MAASSSFPHSGVTLWLTGLSGSGKSTLSERLAQEFQARDFKFEVLDGDEIRTHLSAGLGFSKEDRDTNVRRIGWVCQLLSRNGLIAMTAAIAPYAQTRAQVREMVEKSGAAFVEVYVKCSLEELVRRDVKGLYKRALAGEIPHFTGVSDPYEEPQNPDVLIESEHETVEESFAKIIRYLEENELMARR